MADLQKIYESAADAVEQNDHQKAIVILNSVLEKNPADEVALGQLMDIYFNLDKFKYYITRANLNTVQGLHQHAINDLKKALAIDASHAPARFMIATLYEASKKNMKAIDEYLRVLDLDPKNKEAYKRLTNLYIVEQTFESAIETLQRALKHLKGDEELSNGLAKLYFDKSNYDKALDYVKDTALKAKILLQKNDNSAALEEINKLKKDATYYSLIAQYDYNCGEYDKCLENVDKYEKQGGENVLVYQMKALAFGAKGEEAQSHYYWGLCHKARGRNEEALNEFLQAYQLDKNDKNTLKKIAEIYEIIGEQYPAIEFWEKVYNIDKDDHARKILGEFYLKHGDYGTAAKYGFKKAENVETDEGFLNKFLGFFIKN